MEQIPRKLELYYQQLGKELLICLGKILVESKHVVVPYLVSAAGAGTS